MVKRKLLDPAARGRKGGKARLRTMTTEERQRSARTAVLARWLKATAEQKSEAARKAVLARWARVKKKPPKTGQ
jgi:hypothetical protein